MGLGLHLMRQMSVTRVPSSSLTFFDICKSAGGLRELINCYRSPVRHRFRKTGEGAERVLSLLSACCLSDFVPGALTKGSHTRLHVVSILHI